MSDNIKGILWIISRGFWAAIAVIIIRQLSTDLPLLFILSFVNIIIVIKMLGWFAITGRSRPKTKHIHIYVIRALIGLVSMGMWMYAAISIPIATLTALNFTAPLFTVVLAITLLKEKGSASLAAGDTASLSPIKEFGAKPYTEDEEKTLSEIIESFNQRHGTEFTKDDFLRFEKVNAEILADEDLRDLLKNNPPDVVYNTFSQAFFEEFVKHSKRDNQLQNIIMTDSLARDQAIKHFFSRALREIKEK